MTAATRTDRDAPKTERILSLDRLAALPSQALRELYGHGGVPDDLTELDGRPKGRMLAVRGAEGGPVGWLLRALARHPRFPWDGKSFFAEREDEGRGVNRIDLFVRRFEWFPFATRVEPSVVDGAPCVHLDYASANNPWPIARIRDELREVAPGLYLGPALWTAGDGAATHLLWFAVDFQQPR